MKEFVSYWATRLKCSETAISQLSGGRNNIVIKCEREDSCRVVKYFPYMARDKGNRMLAEIQFLRYANKVAPEYVPRLLEIDFDRKCIVIEWVEGDVFEVDTPPNIKAVNAAIDFFRKLNITREQGKEYITQSAAEGFLHITGHLDNIEHRVRKMTVDHVAREVKTEAKGLVDFIKDEFNEVRKATLKLLEEGRLCNELSIGERCISASDFGFHNAKVTTSGLKFIDFEFAGWDDPAKAIVDFTLQPSVPIVKYGLPLLRSTEDLFSDKIRDRCVALVPVLRLKWMCIILSVLDKNRYKEFMSLDSEDTKDSVFERRIKTAIDYAEKTREISV